jgi:hypothetical protein
MPLAVDALQNGGPDGRPKSKAGSNGVEVVALTTIPAPIIMTTLRLANGAGARIS